MKDAIDPWPEMDFRCPKCDWSGKGADTVISDMSPSGCERACPKCKTDLFWLDFPLVEEVLANFDKLSPENQQLALKMKAARAAWESCKLRSVDQLPEIEDDYFVLLWDADPKTDEVIIRHGQREIFRFKAPWEHWKYFIAACGILKTKYGHRLLDVVPTPRVDIDLCGDASQAPEAVRKIRELIAFDRYPPRLPPPGMTDPFFGPEVRQRWKEYCKLYT